MNKPSLVGWFNDCNSVEELNRERTILQSNINAEYTIRKNELMNATPPFKKLPIVTMEQTVEPDSTVFVAFPIEYNKAKKDEVIFEQNGTLRI